MMCIYSFMDRFFKNLLVFKRVRNLRWKRSILIWFEGSQLDSRFQTNSDWSQGESSPAGDARSSWWDGSGGRNLKGDPDQDDVIRSLSRNRAI